MNSDTEALLGHETCENSRDCIKCANRIDPAYGVCFSCHTAEVRRLREENERLREAVARVEQHCTENAHPGVMHHPGDLNISGLKISGKVVFADSVLEKLRCEQPRATADAGEGGGCERNHGKAVLGECPHCHQWRAITDGHYLCRVCEGYERAPEHESERGDA